jgi:hypothetical protein
LTVPECREAANPNDALYVPSLFSNVVTCGAGTISPQHVQRHFRTK